LAIAMPRPRILAIPIITPPATAIPTRPSAKKKEQTKFNANFS